MLILALGHLKTIAELNIKQAHHRIKNPMDTIASDVMTSPETSTSNYAADANDWYARKSSLSFWEPKIQDFFLSSAKAPASSSAFWTSWCRQTIMFGYLSEMAARQGTKF